MAQELLYHSNRGHSHEPGGEGVAELVGIEGPSKSRLSDFGADSVDLPGSQVAMGIAAWEKIVKRGDS